MIAGNERRTLGHHAVVTIWVILAELGAKGVVYLAGWEVGARFRGRRSSALGDYFSFSCVRSCHI